MMDYGENGYLHSKMSAKMTEKLIIGVGEGGCIKDALGGKKSKN